MDIGEEIVRIQNVAECDRWDAVLLLGLLRSLRMVGQTKEEIVNNMLFQGSIITMDGADYDIMEQLGMDENDYQLWMFELLLENYHLYPTERDYQLSGTDPRALTATDIIERKEAMHAQGGGNAAQGQGYYAPPGRAVQADGAGAPRVIPGTAPLEPPRAPASPVMQMAAEAQSITTDMLATRERLDKLRELLFKTDPRDTNHLGYATEIAATYLNYCSLAERLYHLTSGGANG